MVSILLSFCVGREMFCVNVDCLQEAKPLDHLKDLQTRMFVYSSVLPPEIREGCQIRMSLYSSVLPPDIREGWQTRMSLYSSVLTSDIRDWMARISHNSDNSPVLTPDRWLQKLLPCPDSKLQSTF
jgi:hypothetical protein